MPVLSSYIAIALLAQVAGELLALSFSTIIAAVFKASSASSICPLMDP